MSERNHTFDTHAEENIVPDVLARLSDSAYWPKQEERPRRCRAVIFNPDGTKVLGIRRTRPGREPYVVYPGGGLEETDVTAVDGVWRELSEELALTPREVVLTGAVLQHEGEFFYLGVAHEELQELTIGGPEAARSLAESGTYAPGWFDATGLDQMRFFPEEVSAVVALAARQN